MKVLALLGSPRKNGNTGLLLDEYIKGIKETGKSAEITKIYLNDKSIHGCNACDACRNITIGQCVIKDDMQQVYAAFNNADIIIASSPVYFYTVTSDMKKLIDRCQAVWASKYKTGASLVSKKHRIGYAVCTAGEPEDRSYFDCTLKVFELFYKCINTELVDSLLVSDVDTLQVRDRPDVQQQAIEAGRRLRELVKE